MTPEEEGRDAAQQWLKEHFLGHDVLSPTQELDRYVFRIQKAGRVVHELSISENFLGDRRDRLDRDFADCGLLKRLEQAGRRRVQIPEECGFLEDAG